MKTIFKYLGIGLVSFLVISFINIKFNLSDSIGNLFNNITRNNDEIVELPYIEDGDFSGLEADEYKRYEDIKDHTISSGKRDQYNNTLRLGYDAEHKPSYSNKKDEIVSNAINLNKSEENINYAYFLLNFDFNESHVLKVHYTYETDFDIDSSARLYLIRSSDQGKSYKIVHTVLNVDMMIDFDDQELYHYRNHQKIYYTKFFNYHSRDTCDFRI